VASEEVSQEMELSATTGALLVACNCTVLDTRLKVAVRMTCCARGSEGNLTANPALFSPAGTTTAAGTDTTELLLVTWIAAPPSGAIPVNSSLQFATPVVELLAAHDSASSPMN
jgi:hypothetical protein